MVTGALVQDVRTRGDKQTGKQIYIQTKSILPIYKKNLLKIFVEN